MPKIGSGLHVICSGYHPHCMQVYHIGRILDSGIIILLDSNTEPTSKQTTIKAGVYVLGMLSKPFSQYICSG